MNQVQPTLDAPDLETSEVARALSRISDALLESYGKLARHAERVEKELVAANEALAAKVLELDRSSAHLQSILESLPTGVVVRDASGAIVRTNSAARSLLCVDGAPLEGTSDHPLLLGANARGETRWVAVASGDERAIGSRWSPIESGGSVEILDDRTDVERLGERLHALDKMAALGRVAGGIAHEIRNPLNAVRGFGELLRREMTPGTKHHRFASRICEGCEEANQIVASMLCFAAPERLAQEPCEPASLVADAITAALRVLPEDAPEGRWTVESSITAPAFVADRVQLRQALRNLVANALQAQTVGGRVRVTLERESREIVLRVEDAGPGIPSALRRRVADPFFTTRADGTGLGLALVHTIAELHGGRLSISSRPSALGGAEVEIRLPFQPPQGEKP